MNQNPHKILIVEDEASIRNFIKTTLTANGYHVITADSCQEGVSAYFDYMPDLILLDLGLPDQDGCELISRIRTRYTTPILILSARSDESDKVSALDLGANDYITKPFGTAELLARVRAALRTYRPGETISPTGIFTLQDLQIDYDRRLVTVGAEEIHLTQTEFNILSLLSLHTGKVLTYAAIIRAVWGYSDPSSIKKLQVNMANLRKKLGSKPGADNYILNELGVGYRMKDKPI